MFKIILLTIISFFFVSCAQPTVYNYVQKNKTLSLGASKNNQINIRLTRPKYVDTFDSCTINSYKINDKNIEYGNIFIENIDLGQNCYWYGLSTSFFESNFKDKLNLSSIEVVEEFDIRNYNFKTYLINKNSYMNLILIFGAYKDTIILDYNGKLYTKVLKSFKPNYINKHLSKKRFSSNYSESLVRDNMFNGYFGLEIESIREQ